MTQRRISEKILLVTYPDSWIELYSETYARVHHAEVLATVHELEAEQYLEQCMPPWARALFDADHKRYAGLPTSRTPAEELDRVRDIELLRSLAWTKRQSARSRKTR